MSEKTNKLSPKEQEAFKLLKTARRAMRLRPWVVTGELFGADMRRAPRLSVNSETDVWRLDLTATTSLFNEAAALGVERTGIQEKGVIEKINKSGLGVKIGEVSLHGLDVGYTNMSLLPSSKRHYGRNFMPWSSSVVVGWLDTETVTYKSHILQYLGINDREFEFRSGLWIADVDEYHSLSTTVYHLAPEEIGRVDTAMQKGLDVETAGSPILEFVEERTRDGIESMKTARDIGLAELGPLDIAEIRQRIEATFGLER